MTVQPWNAKEKVTLLLSLVPFIEQHGPTPLATLSTHFNIPIRELRDLAMFLGTAGIPGESKVSLDNDMFDIDWDALLEDDVLDITNTIAVDQVPRFSGTETAALLAGLSQIRMLLKDEQPHIADLTDSAAKKLALATNPVRAELSLEHSYEAPPSPYSEITRAIRDDRVISFTYESRRGEVTKRTVDPLRTLQVRNAWYLRAYCHDQQDTRLFRLEMMRNLTVSETRAAHRLDHNEHVQDAAFPETNLDWHVLVYVFPDARYLLEGWSPKHIDTLADGRLALEVSLVHPERVIDLVCEAPLAIEVVDPPELRTLVHDWASALNSADSATATMNG